MDLQGRWRFRLDEADVGIENQWNRELLEDSILLPGILQAQGYGNEISKDTPFVDGLHDRLWFLREEYREFVQEHDTRVPFLAQPVRHYVGVAWYQREIEIPQEWEGLELVLKLELVHWKSTVWVDTVCYGDFDSLCVPHTYELGQLAPGKHTLTVRVDNRMIYPYRPDAHGVSDSVGHSWNGIAGTMELRARPILELEQVEVYPEIAHRSAILRIRLRNQRSVSQHCFLRITSRLNLNMEDLNMEGEVLSLPVLLDEKRKEITCNVPLGESALLWDEFQPALQQLTISLFTEEGELADTRSVRFGLRSIQAKGRDFLLNGRKICFRGTHDACCFPLTGYPSPEAEEWRRIYRVCRQWGLNHIRFHSFCPPEAAFEAADEMGMYLQVETGMWNYFLPGGQLEKQLYVETDRILSAYGGHPSFLLMSSGNEPHGDYRPIMKEWVAKYRETDNRHLYCTQSGWPWPQPPELDVTDYVYTCSRYGASRMRGRGGWEGRDYQQYIEDMEVPMICHELGQYCSYPDFSVIEKFTGYLRPGNYEIDREIARKHGLLSKNADFVQASGLLQTLCYKEEIEANLRTPGFSGFSLLDLHDYLGQGSALVGLLDAFWEEKPYADAAAFRRFCAPTVPLARISRVVYTQAESFDAEVEIACYAREGFSAAEVYWKIMDAEQRVWMEGRFAETEIPTGGNTPVGRLEFPLHTLPAPCQYQLVIGIEGAGVENQWKLWVYPAELDFQPFRAVKVTESFPEAVELLKEGEKVLYLPRPEQIHYSSPALSPLPVFWNGHMGPKWSRGLGMWCDKRHPALRSFPTECGAEWQWNEIVEGARGMNLETLPEVLEPILWPIDDWNRSQKLALAFEARMYQGRLLVCSADLKKDLEKRYAARQLLYSFLQYMDSEEFQPRVMITEKELGGFLFDTTIMERLHANIRVTEGLPEGNAGVEEEMHTGRAARQPVFNVVSNLLDGDPNTYWLAGGKYGGQYPFTLEITIEEPTMVRGLLVVPRQNHRDREGAVKRYEIWVSEDNIQWSCFDQGEFPASFQPQEILFERAVRLKGLRLRLLEGFSAENLIYWDRVEKVGFGRKQENYADPCAALAEIDFLCEETLAEGEHVRVAYQDVATASEEIY